MHPGPMRHRCRSRRCPHSRRSSRAQGASGSKGGAGGRGPEGRCSHDVEASPHAASYQEPVHREHQPQLPPQGRRGRARAARTALRRRKGKRAVRARGPQHNRPAPRGAPACLGRARACARRRGAWGHARAWPRLAPTPAVGRPCPPRLRRSLTTASPRSRWWPTLPAWWRPSTRPSPTPPSSRPPTRCGARARARPGRLRRSGAGAAVPPSPPRLARGCPHPAVTYPVLAAPLSQAVARLAKELGLTTQQMLTKQMLVDRIAGRRRPGRGEPAGPAFGRM